MTGIVGMKGGALLSTLFMYTQHGDPEGRGLVKHLLNQVRVVSLLCGVCQRLGQTQIRVVY